MRTSSYTGTENLSPRYAFASPEQHHHQPRSEAGPSRLPVSSVQRPIHSIQSIQSVQSPRQSNDPSTPHPIPPDEYEDEDPYAVQQYEEQQQRTFVRALFDFDASDPSALSFRAGDVIEVITTLDSGWWDGQLGDERGWFPSNFVVVVELDEFETLVDDMDGSALAGETGRTSKMGFEGRRGGANEPDLGETGVNRNLPQHERGPGIGYTTRNAGQARDTNNNDDYHGTDVNIARHIHTDLNEARSIPSLANIVRPDLTAHPHSPFHPHPYPRSQSRNGQTAESVDIEDVLSGDWGWSSSGGFDDLALEMMDTNSRQEAAEEEARQFEEEARRRREMIGQAGSEDLDVMMRTPDQSVAGARRQREETGGTVRDPGTTRAIHRLARGSVDSSAEITPGRKAERLSMMTMSSDAWVPSLTPDGQVYYHNTQTGEDSWELPVNTPRTSEDGYYGRSEEDHFRRFSSSGQLSDTYALHDSPEPQDSDFCVPPKAQRDIPYPWTAKLSDDGREWYYYNRITGQSRRDLPVTGTEVVELSKGVARMNVASKGDGTRPVRASVEARRKTAHEWEKRTADRLKKQFEPTGKPNMGGLMDALTEALREIFEAAVAGSAAEEEMSRAVDLGSERGIAAAISREASAIEMLKVALGNTLSAIRALLSGFGYTGPPLQDKLDEMPRPPWAGDMTLIGSVGLLSSTAHVALTSRGTAMSSSSSVWADVLRGASKLKDVVGAFPRSVLPSTPVNLLDGRQGQPIEAWLGIEGVTRPFSGQWGFAKSDSALRPLEQNAVMEVQVIKGDLEAALRNAKAENVVELLRLATKFKDAIMSIDIASHVDVDGDGGDLVYGNRPREDDFNVYTNLVSRARKALLDIQSSTSVLDDSCFILFTHLASGDVRKSCEMISSATVFAFQALSTLLIVSKEQMELLETGNVVGQLGYRSPNTLLSKNRLSRPYSMTSNQSRFSKRSSHKARARGLEEEFLDQELENEDPDSVLEVPPSATGSTSSLNQLGSAKLPKKSDASAASSTTSLAYQATESDTGSAKEKNRMSIMNFMRGRSGSDMDNQGTMRNKQPSRKLAKLLGEDIEKLPTVPPPPSAPLAPVERPWYLGDDYEPQDVVIGKDNTTKAGTINALVARLTPHGSTDTSFFQAFLLTFRSFTSGKELLDLLMERYNIPAPEGLDPDQMKDWVRSKQTPIRLRVFNVIRSWFDVHFALEDMVHLDRLVEFAKTMTDAGLSLQVLKVVDKRRKGELIDKPRSVSGGIYSPPTPLIPRVLPGRTLRLMDIAPLEIARQLTILEFNFFQRIRPIECLNKAWNREDGEEKAPNVRSVIHTANVLSGWVVFTILSSNDAKTRANMMKYFIQAALELRNLNNFSSMAAIAAGLNSAPLTRLKRTKELLSQKTLALKADLDRTLDSTKNFSYYKEMLKTINPPCVPFFGFWLSAFTFIEDGNKDFLYVHPDKDGNMVSSSSSASLSAIAQQATVFKSPVPATKGQFATAPEAGPSSSVANEFTKPPVASPANTPSKGLPALPANGLSSSSPTKVMSNGKPLINFFKRSLSAEILRDIQQYQSQHYNLAQCKPVYDFIQHGLDKTDKRTDDVYDISLRLEPREKEEERITRMLHDSGFI